MGDTVSPWEALEGLPVESVRKLALNLMAVAVDETGTIQQLSDGSCKRSWGNTGYSIGRELLNWCDCANAIKEKTELRKKKKEKDPNSDLSGRLLGHLRENYKTLFGKEINLNYGRDRKLFNELLRDGSRTEEQMREYLTFWLECGMALHPIPQVDEWTQKNIFGNGDVKTFVTKLQRIDVEMATRKPKDTSAKKIPWAVRRQMEGEVAT